MRIAVLRSGRELKYEGSFSLEEFRDSISDYSDEELFDAYMVLLYICLTIRREQSNRDFNWWRWRSISVEEKLGHDKIEQLKTTEGLHSLKEQKVFAHHMIDEFWR